ncbi:hypothetical protein HYH03_017386 [Edaphochlamys debaryana]|uniref:Protein kinase domain-containing protein n=1 Tax=Edaphochlamys debaryana TaxID=47281 RepID=A0A836BNZ6_9CHLO|nr:hypothetical protein HYH03_017386 [Edaphochlamys debaryana]|eukprot:KAG2483791.1 hypothetical protein HYH03_017386 [Edaphochlamys debaryana]
MEVDEPPLQLKPALSLVPERIKIIKSLGRGGFSVVYLALLQKPGGEARHVALKLCQPQGANADPRIKHQVVQLFLREAALTQSLNHKHIICCYGTMELPAGFPGVMGLTGPVYGMALDLCEPTSAKHLIMRAYTQGRHRAYSTDQALEWLAQVASALAHLHTHEPVVIHRDIKQENILFKKVAGGRLEAVLADLGLHVTLEAERGAMLRRRLPSGSGPGTITEGLCEGCDDSEPGQPPPWGATGGGTPFASPFLSLASGIHCSVKGGGRAEAAAARAVAAADDEAHGAGEGAGQPGGAAAGVQAVAAKGPPAARLPAVCASSFRSGEGLKSMLAG